MATMGNGERDSGAVSAGGEGALFRAGLLASGGWRADWDCRLLMAQSPGGEPRVRLNRADKRVVAGWAGMTRGISGVQRWPPKPIRKIASENSRTSRAFISGNLRIDSARGITGIDSEAVGPLAR
jgi:hypothetical protein